MQMKPQELIKAIVEGVGKLIDARAKTTEEVLKAELRGEVRSSIEALEKKHSKKFDLLIAEVSSNVQVIKEVKTEVKEVKSEVKALRTGVAKKMVEQDERLDNLEEATGTSSTKH